MSSLANLLKENEILISEVSAMEGIIVRMIEDSEPLKNIIPDTVRFNAIAEDLMYECKVRRFSEESIIIAIKNIYAHKEQYPTIDKNDMDMLYKIKMVR